MRLKIFEKLDDRFLKRAAPRMRIPAPTYDAVDVSFEPAHGWQANDIYRIEARWGCQAAVPPGTLHEVKRHVREMLHRELLGDARDEARRALHLLWTEGFRSGDGAYDQVARLVELLAGEEVE